MYLHVCVPWYLAPSFSCQMLLFFFFLAPRVFCYSSHLDRLVLKIFTKQIKVKDLASWKDREPCSSESIHLKSCIWSLELASGLISYFYTQVIWNYYFSSPHKQILSICQIHKKKNHATVNLCMDLLLFNEKKKLQTRIDLLFKTLFIFLI